MICKVGGVGSVAMACASNASSWLRFCSRTNRFCCTSAPPSHLHFQFQAFLDIFNVMCDARKPEGLTYKQQHHACVSVQLQQQTR